MEVAQILIKGNPSKSEIQGNPDKLLSKSEAKKHKVNDNDLFSKNNI